MRALALALALLGTAGCDSRDAGTAPDAFPSPSSWQVAQVDGVPAPSGDDAVIGTVLFDGREVSGVGGCNRYEASYSARSGGGAGRSIDVTGFTATEAGCPLALRPFEERMFDALRAVSAWRIEADGRLVLLGPSTELELSPIYEAYDGAR